MKAIHLLRMARLARHPPSLGRVLLIFGVVAFCLALFGAEWLGLTPDWLSMEPGGSKMPKARPLP